MIVLHQFKDDIGTKADSRDIDRCTYIPAKGLGDLLEYNKCRVSRPDKEHIEAPIGCLAKQQIDCECDTA